MEFYTLHPWNFTRKVLVDHYDSAIWTERYIEAGDFTLVVPATTTMINLLVQGTLLELKGVKDPMLIHTQSIENGALTVTGNSLEKWLDEFYIRDMKLTGVPGNIMGQIAYQAHFNNTGFLGPETPTTPWILGDLETSGTSITKHVPASQEAGAYTTLLAMAQKFNIGMRVYLRARTIVPDPNPLGPAVIFSTRKGADLTGQNSGYPYIRFSEDLQNFANVKELSSIADWKNMVYAFPPKVLLYENGSSDGSPVPFYSRFSSVTNISDHPPFTRRLAAINATDITADMLGTGTWEEKQDKYFAILNRRATKLLNEHRKNIIVDGEVPPEGLLRFEKDFKLGDTVQVQKSNGTILWGRVTEYIRSSDTSGTREYPTIIPELDKVSALQYLPNYGSDLDFSDTQYN